MKNFMKIINSILLFVIMLTFSPVTCEIAYKTIVPKKTVMIKKY